VEGLILKPLREMGVRIEEIWCVVRGGVEGSGTDKRDADSTPSDLDFLPRKQTVGEIGTGGKAL
jgi:hypothetical protein